MIIVTFSEQLNQYVLEIDCTAKDLAEASDLSPAVISRYRSGTRVPASDSDTLVQLSRGIAALSDERYTQEAVLAKFQSVLSSNSFDFQQLIENLNQLIDAANLNINRLARSLNYDASYISRIRTGQRHPADPEAFVDGICRFVSSNISENRAAVAALLEKPVEALDDPRTAYSILRTWLCSGNPRKSNGVDHFLNKLDEFDLNEYIRAIRFNELNVPSLPFQLSTSKNYYGLEQMRTGELDFFKSTVLSHSMENVFMCSDMEMGDMAKDLEFAKKWMFAIAMCLKKGLHLNMIHTIDRPFEEMMLGLESWIPLYMTGQVSSFYLKAQKSGIYQHATYVSGAAALSGEAISGHHSQGKYYLTKKAEEISYYRKRSEHLLKKASPLMEIFRKEQSEQYQALLQSDVHVAGKRHGILSAPPIYTIPDDLLSELLTRSGCTEADQKAISTYAQYIRDAMDVILSHSSVFDEIPQISAEDFSDHPIFLSLEGLFPEKNIPYDYETYCRHMKATKSYAESHPNYTVRFNVQCVFQRMQIFIHEGEFAMISKSNDPVVHFVIRQPNLREAIETMVIPIVETD